MLILCISVIYFPLIFPPKITPSYIFPSGLGNYDDFGINFQLRKHTIGQYVTLLPAIAVYVCIQ